MKKRALLVVDMQNRFHFGFGRISMDKAVETIVPVLESFRSQGDLVVWIQHESHLLGLKPGTKAFSLVDSLVPLPEEKLITKRKGNAFLGTDLDSYLRSFDVEGIYICGYSAEGCVHATYRGGRHLGYSAYKLKHGVASASPFFLKLFSRRGESVDRRELVP